MICVRCDQAIRPGQPYTHYDIHSLSAAGKTVHWHLVCPPKPRG